MISEAHAGVKMDEDFKVVAPGPMIRSCELIKPFDVHDEWAFG